MCKPPNTFSPTTLHNFGELLDHTKHTYVTSSIVVSCGEVGWVSGWVIGQGFWVNEWAL